MGSGGCFTQVEHPPFYVAARGLARLPLYGVPAARLRAGHARPLHQKPPFDKEGQTVEKPPSAREVPRRGGGREPCHSPKYFGQPHSSLPHRLRAEPPRRGGQGVGTPFSARWPPFDKGGFFLLAHFFIFFALWEHFLIILHKLVAFAVPIIL